MSNRNLSILLLILLVSGIVLAAGVLVVGPESVEDQTVELYEVNQELLAEQGAGRIWETLRDIEVRLATSASHKWAWLDEAQSKADFERALSRLSHPSDPDFGITLAVLDRRGEVIAVEPGAMPERVAILESHVHGTSAVSPAVSLNACRRCLLQKRSLLVAAEMEQGRVLAASIDLERLSRGIFDQISRSRSTYAALLDGTGEVIYSAKNERERSQGRWVVGQAKVPGTELRLEIAAPRSVIAPEVRSRVQKLLYVTYGVLGLLLACVLIFALLKRREQSEHLSRVRSLAHQDKLATLGMMAASTAHEIRNAIAVASLQLQLADTVDDDDQQSVHLGKAAESVDRLADLAQSLSRYAGKDQERLEKVDLSRAVEDALGVVQPKIQDGAVVEVEADEQLVVFGSHAALVQVVVNLVINALDAIDAHGEAGLVEVRTWREGGDALISVTDNGEGISPAVLDQIFEPFFSTKNGEAAEGGTGIGLWLCSQIIEQHGGTIDVENVDTGSVDSGGARFVIRLPIESQVSAA